MAVDEILIEATPTAWRAAIIEKSRLIDLVVAVNDGRGVEGDIYLGRVVRVLPGMGGAFVEIALERPALLETKRTPPREGEIVTAQLVEPAVGRKGARVSRRIAIAGTYLVLLPGDDGVALSKQIEDPRQHAPIVNALRSARQPGEGLIVRTAALGVDEAALQAELQTLRARWQTIISRRDTASSPPAILYQEPPEARLATELASFETGAIIVDSAATSRALATAAPGLTARITVNKERTALFERYDIADRLTELGAANVALPSGGALTIEATAALTAIDIDSGASTDAKLRLTTNLEAAREIARQIRLRDIFGVIVVDFIRLEPHVDRNRVLTELRVAIQDDRRNVTVFGYTAAGHVEMLRVRRGAKDK
jgi:ribonuclease G